MTELFHKVLALTFFLNETEQVSVEDQMQNCNIYIGNKGNIIIITHITLTYIIVLLQRVYSDLAQFPQNFKISVIH